MADYFTMFPKVSQLQVIVILHENDSDTTGKQILVTNENSEKEACQKHAVLSKKITAAIGVAL